MGLNFLSLTDDDENHFNYDYEDEDVCKWMDDSECQENLPTIFSLNPEECIVDADNHIKNVDGLKLFFEELGYLCEEPEPIDPSRDYDAEAAKLLEERNRTRKMHVQLSSLPSLDENSSGLSSNSSSFHCQDNVVHMDDIRSALNLNTDYNKANQYHYASYCNNPAVHSTS